MNDSIVSQQTQDAIVAIVTAPGGWVLVLLVVVTVLLGAYCVIDLVGTELWLRVQRALKNRPKFTVTAAGHEHRRHVERGKMEAAAFKGHQRKKQDHLHLITVAGDKQGSVRR
jgi:hypothetical protein